jgi:pilus assembly protein TadC
VTFVAVSVLCLAATAPWWWAGVHVRRRAHGMAGVVDDPPPDAAPSARVDLPVLLELVAAAVRAGAGVPRALEAVASAVGAADGRVLRAVASALRLGAEWDAAWDAAAARGDDVERLDPLRRALRSAWNDGAAPGESLRAAGQDVLHERRATARTAAARLGVRLVLPLGVCYLPAFVLLGLTPVLLALGVDLLTG